MHRLVGAKNERSTAFSLCVAVCVLTSSCFTEKVPPPPLDANVDSGVAGDREIPPFSCTVVAPTSCPDPPPTYATVKPIFESRCVGCHSGASELWPLTTYSHVASWYDTIPTEVVNCNMPPWDAGIPMTNDERLSILTWLRCGFPQ